MKKKGPPKRAHKKKRRKGVMGLGENKETLIEHRELEYLQAVWRKKGTTHRNEKEFIEEKWEKIEEAKKEKENE